MPMLRPNVDSRNPRKQVAALAGLLGAGQIQLDDEVARRLLDRKQPAEIRLLALTALVVAPVVDPTLYPQLMGMLSEPAVELRLVAWQWLIRMAAADVTYAPRLIPWLGVITESPQDTHSSQLGVPLLDGRLLRRQIADVLAPHLGMHPTLRTPVVAMLHAPPWQARQGAAWALSSMPGEVPAEIHAQISALLDDLRSPDDDLLERLQAARALLAAAGDSSGHIEPYVALAKAGLQFGQQEWELIPIHAREVRLCAVRLAALLPEIAQAEQLVAAGPKT